MSDYLCRVCGEPWDAYGVKRDGSGDMAAWEADLFLKGAGCPSCKGVPPAGDTEALKAQRLTGAGASIILNTLDDREGDHDLAVLGWDDTPPAWKRPTGKVVLKCDACGLLLREDVDLKTAGPEIKYPDKDPHGYGRRGGAHEIDLADPEAWRTIPELPGKRFCPDCVQDCADCHETPIFDGAVGRDMVGDTYDPGASFLRPGCYGRHDIICVGCLENYCGTCEYPYGENPDHCEECNPEPDEAA